MDTFISKLENLKEIRQKLEKEVRYLTERSILLDGAEERFAALTGQIQELEARFATVSGADRVLERIEERMLKFEEYRKSFEAFFRDLADRRKYFETTLNTIEKSRREAAESAMMAKNIADQLERIDMRRDAARKEIEELEKRVASLQHMDREFQKVEARFEQMETLLTDLEQKQDQIATMSKKIGEIAKQSDFMRGELESLLSEAGEKMDRLSAFYETVDQMLQEAERAAAESRAETKPSSDRRKAGSLEEWKKEGILSLYVNHKWEPELIAERMKIDVATVRSVIGTYKQSHPV
jgi:DNA repair exonuclease SbcCD ATPase subunit